jgi:Salmonella virulence plasmid 65kDa B protein/Insecticide toxin TcdB middle/C-terminal region/Insecticide toxin TcdB middle/N-terminal region/FG-GAP-like repeat
VNHKPPAKADSQKAINDNFVIGAPTMNLPKGGGAISGIGEKFAANPVTGTGSMSVPIFASPGRAGFGPQLSLSYDSGSGNGPFGFGWGMAVPAITRKTDKGLPRYGDDGIEDSFILAGAEDLVPFGQLDAGQWIEETQERLRFGKTYSVRRFRPRTEDLFSRIEQWVNATDATDIAWRTISKENVSSWFGIDPQSRISDPENPARVFSWLISLSHDDKGNVVSYGYVADNEAGISTALVCEKNRTAANRSSNKYLKRIKYGNRSPYFLDFSSSVAIDLPADWCFELVFDFGDHGSLSPVADTDWLSRSDAFSSYKAGFEVRTSRLCRRVLMFHHFPESDGVGQDCLVHSTDFEYSEPDDDVGAGFTHLMSVSQVGYRRSSAGYASSATPPIEFEYSLATIDQSVHEVDKRSLENLPRGIDGSQYQWVDLHGEGLSGILAEQAGSWLYKRNLSPAPQFAEQTSEQVNFGSLVLEKSKPLTGALSSGQQLLDLDGDGQLDLVNFGGNTPGYFERARDGHWSHFLTFAELPITDWSSQELKFVDLTGDGHADILISEDDVFCWHESKGKNGFGAAQRVTKALDEEVGPRIAFSDSSQMIALADMSGDGLSDIVRIRNGDVCYWPNLGYGRFGAKVTMDAAPVFDNDDIFDIRRLRLADVDGSGTTDILYFSARGAALFFNRSGNQWSNAQYIEQFPLVDSAASAMIADLKGNGTACLIWSSTLDSGQNQIKYTDLMGGEKPHLLIKTVNNLGAETHMHYAPSTRFYLEDEFAGRPWITRLPFPVHVVERVETHDLISRNRFVTRYAYHHGYFDGVEREFRGFGMVEQWDTEEVASLGDGTFAQADNESIQSNIPPIHTKTWFHTGAWFDHGHISNYFAGLVSPSDQGEYYRPPGLSQIQAQALLLADTVLPVDWDAEEQRQACRVLKGSMLRQEVYALDGSTKEPHPYSIAEQNFTVERLQPVHGKQKGVYHAHPRETLTYHYERIPEDPRIEHGLTLDVDDYGNVRQALAIKYGRQIQDAVLSASDQEKQTTPVVTYSINHLTNAVDEADTYRAPIVSDAQTFELWIFDPSRPTSKQR